MRENFSCSTITMFLLIISRSSFFWGVEGRGVFYFTCFFLLLQRAKIKASLTNDDTSDDHFYTFHLLILILLQVKNCHTHTYQPVSARERTLSGFVFSRHEHLLWSGIFIKALFASMACTMMQMSAREKLYFVNAQTRLQQQKNCRCNSTISGLVKRCDETRSEENRSSHCLGKNTSSFHQAPI